MPRLARARSAIAPRAPPSHHDSGTHLRQHAGEPDNRCASTAPSNPPSAVATFRDPTALERARQGRGWAALLVVRLDNGAVFKSLHGFLEGSQQAWVRLHGDRGLMENLRQTAPDQDVYFGVELSITG
jgi:hypothetical protein